MTKQELQKEIQDKVKPGIKPSDLKKLKRSKSAGDIPKASPLPSSIPLTRSQSNQPFTDPKYPFTTLISQQEKETTAKSDTISLLRKKIESLEKNPPSQLLQEQLKEKQKQIEDLTEKLEKTNTELNNLKNPSSWPLVPTAKFEEVNEISDLDQSLIARHKSLRDWFTEHSKRKKLENELAENIEEASSELIRQDNQISNLRNENRKLKLTNQSLQKDLELAHRAVEWRKSPLSNSDENSWQPLIISLFLIVWFILLLNNSWKKHFKETH